jgi:hypothetical protein
VENQGQVYHHSHRPWKSLQDFHTPAVLRLLIDKPSEKGRSVTQLIAFQRVSAWGCSPACLSLGVQSSVSQLGGAVQCVTDVPGPDPSKKWRAQGDDFRTFVADFVSALPQVELRCGLSLSGNRLTAH